MLAGVVGNGRLHVPSLGSSAAQVEQFRKVPDRVVIAPSWREGLDFPDEDARFCIVAKVPFLSLGDPVVSLKLRREGGQRWYSWKAAMAVVQAAGRIVRHEADYGTTYILDANWKRVGKQAPAWFDVQETTL